ncbi:hypothetical protein ElyMa_002571300 [Elysia marginata]|uniref:Uncharacterized protein n=1 Tax=Elysia marginata TaxID=1093978 RepID=A0AAV4GXF3_9GAST|nr:hypothetical protein ElyMa_002571300 [Elysia marginata]
MVIKGMKNLKSAGEDYNSLRGAKSFIGAEPECLIKARYFYLNIEEIPNQCMEKCNNPDNVSFQDSAHHQRCSTPPLVFLNVICLVSFTASSPYTYTAISMVNAESRFVTEYDTSPLDAISSGMFLGP